MRAAPAAVRPLSAPWRPATSPHISAHFTLFSVPILSNHSQTATKESTEGGCHISVATGSGELVHLSVQLGNTSLSKHQFSTFTCDALDWLHLNLSLLVSTTSCGRGCLLLLLLLLLGRWCVVGNWCLGSLACWIVPDVNFGVGALEMFAGDMRQRAAGERRCDFLSRGVHEHVLVIVDFLHILTAQPTTQLSGCCTSGFCISKSSES